MSDRPIRLVLSDDTQRTRLTVFFRALLALPHYVWIVLWGLAVVLILPVDWLVTLLRGRSPSALHVFLAAYVKYATQLYAYLSIAADPYPAFDGRVDYPLAVTIEPPRRQSRWRVGFRGLLALPALFLLEAIFGDPTFGIFTFFVTSTIGLLHLVALLGWFVSLARGRSSRGLRDVAAYGVGYAASFWAYAFLLTDRYPDSDPATVLEDLPVRSDPIHAELDQQLRRNRLTVLFRGPLAAPHLVWLLLWGIAATFALIANWFVVLFTTRSAARLHRFLAAYLRYQYNVYAYLLLVGGPFPAFSGAAGGYPCELVVAERAPQEIVTVVFRLPLVLPALALASAYQSVATIAAIGGWFAALATGRMPRGLRNLAGLALRYQAQVGGYLMVLTDAYPYSGPCTSSPPAPAAPALLPAPAAETS